MLHLRSARFGAANDVSLGSLGVRRPCTSLTGPSRPSCRLLDHPARAQLGRQRGGLSRRATRGRSTIQVPGCAWGGPRVDLPRSGHDGLGMAANIGARPVPGHRLEPTAGRAPELADLGATFASTAAEVAAGSEVVVVCVSDTPDVEAVLFGPDGVAEGAQEARWSSTARRSRRREAGIRRAPRRQRPRLRRRPGVRRERGRPERDPDHLRRRHERGRRAGPAGR